MLSDGLLSDITLVVLAPPGEAEKPEEEVSTAFKVKYEVRSLM